MAGQIWRGERTHLSERLAGLNSEQSVRSRLRVLAAPLVQSTDLEPAARAGLETTDFARDDPLSVLERTEAIVSAQISMRYPTLDTFDLAAGTTDHRISRLLITQCVAGRLGRWAVRKEEIADAKLARGLVKKLGAVASAQPESLVIAGEELYRMGQYSEAATCLLDADRTHRSVDGLFKAAVCLWKSENYLGALWAIRTCLLEDVADFDGADDLLKAQMIESSLRTMVEGRGAYDPQQRLRQLPEEASQNLLSTIDEIEETAFRPREE